MTIRDSVRFMPLGLFSTHEERELKRLAFVIGVLRFVEGLWILFNQISGPLPFEIFVGFAAIAAGFGLAKDGCCPSSPPFSSCYLRACRVRFS